MASSLPKGRPTVTAKADFSAEEEAQLLRNAMKGLGTDEKQIITVLTRCNAVQRREIAVKYKTMFGKDLIDEFKSELSGRFEDGVIALMMLGPEFDAYSLHKAMRGAGTDEEVVIEIMCSRSNDELKAIKEEYKKKYKNELEKDLISDTSGHFRRLLVSLCQAAREESTTVDGSRAMKDARALHEAGVQKWGTDESTFNMILASRSYPQLVATFDEYAKIAGHDIVSAIDREMSGDLCSGMKAVVKVARNKTAYFAERIMKAMKGLGTDDILLIHLIVSRCEIDLQDVKEEFYKMYKKSITEWLQGDTSGDYRRLLQALVA